LLRWNNGTVYATILSDLGWVAIGQYKPEARMGGCDNLKTIADIKQAILDVLKGDQGINEIYGVVFEGMMISTIRSTFYEFLTSMPDIEPIFIGLVASTDGCVKRIEGRGSMKANLKIDNIANKCSLVTRNIDSYDQAMVRRIKVDTTPKEAMLLKFLEAVGDTELIQEFLV
jgi:hypothetical protein